MKRFMILLCLIILGGAPTSANAQVVSDPILEHLAAQTWVRDAMNAAKIASTAYSSGRQLEENIKQTLTQLKNAKTLADYNRLYVDGKNEMSGIKALIKLGYGITAFDKDAEKQFRKAYPDAPQNQLLSKSMEHWDKATKDSILTAYNFVHLRSEQMDGEEAQISALTSVSTDSKAGTNQILQASLAIAIQQVQELRRMQQMMQQQFALEQAMFMRSTAGSSAIREILTQQHLEQFFGQGAIPARGQ